MSIVFSGVIYTIKKKSDNSIVGTGQTNVSGELAFNLAPGEYTVEITVPSGHEIDNSVLTEPGETPVNTDLLSIEDVTIVDGSTTTLVSNFTTV
jgi:hypothetical protein